MVLPKNDLMMIEGCAWDQDCMEFGFVLFTNSLFVVYLEKR
jgi:hypothetical protein